MNSNRKNRNNPFAVIFLVGIWSWTLLLNGQSFSAEESSDKKTFIVGAPQNKGEDLAKALEKEEEHLNALKKAQKDYENKKYDQALLALKESFHYVNPDNLSSWAEHKLLADIHEAMNQKEDFLKEIDWLIEKSGNEQTRQELADRKNKFLSALRSSA